MTTAFGEDSVTRTWIKPDGTVERVAVATDRTPEWQRGVTLVGYQEWALFPLLQLRRGWQGHTAYMDIANTGELVSGWLDYRVTGEARVAVPAGIYDCWTVTYGGSSDPDYTLWIDKRTGWVVKEGRVSDKVGRERVLLSYDRGQ